MSLVIKIVSQEGKEGILLTGMSRGELLEEGYCSGVDLRVHILKAAFFGATVK